MARRQGSLAVSDAAIDEAFATIAIPERGYNSSHAARETLVETAHLAEALREPLSSLDAQRRRLARLIERLNA